MLLMKKIFQVGFTHLLGKQNPEGQQLSRITPLCPYMGEGSIFFLWQLYFLSREQCFLEKEGIFISVL